MMSGTVPIEDKAASRGAMVALSVGAGVASLAFALDDFFDCFDGFPILSSVRPCAGFAVRSLCCQNDGRGFVLT